MKNSYEMVGDIARIDIGKGVFAVVDTDSLTKLLELDVRWHAHFDYNRYYVYTYLRDRSIKMHRYITDAPEGLVVDHVNGDSLDNRVDNLRVCTQVTNGHNRASLNTNNSSGIRGVSFHKASNKWRAFVRFNRKQIHLGLFKDKVEAENAVISYRKQVFEGDSK